MKPMIARSVVNGKLDEKDNSAAAAISEAQVDNGIPNMNKAKDIGIQAFYVILHLGVGYCVIA